MKEILLETATRLKIGDFQVPWTLIGHSSNTMPLDIKRWVLDVDDITEDSDEFKKICTVIRECDCKFGEPIVMLNKTRTGVHNITHPFNSQQFNDKARIAGVNDIPEIKKNHLTLLYENV